MQQWLTTGYAVVSAMVLAVGLSVISYLAAGDTGLLVSVALLAPAVWVLLSVRGRRASDERILRRLDRVDDELRIVRDRVNRRAHELKRRVEPLRDDIRKATYRIDGRIGQMDHLIGLYHDLRPPVSFPGTGGWAASPDLLRFLYDEILSNGRRRILECGSGTSTLIMAYALRELGSGHLISLDHDARFAEHTRNVLERHGLAEPTDVRTAKLCDVEVAGDVYPWYDPAMLPEGPFDLLVVDGPPKATRPQARFPAVPLLHDRLDVGAMVVLDDHERPDEQAAGRRWVEMFPDLEAESIGHHKNTLVLRRRR